jgi:predicted nucleic acid-binding protein
VVTTRVYADSSALVKRYIDEADRDAVRDLDGLAVSAVAGVEVASAVWRKVRAGLLARPRAEELLGLLRDDLRGGTRDEPGYAVIRPTDQVLRDATEVARSHALRALDAIQLASALAAREVLPECTSFICFDERLRAAAADHGFTLVPA